MPPEPNYFSAQVSDARRFFLELNPKTGARRQITVTSGGWERCRSDYEIQRAGFFSPIIEFVSRGFGTLTLAEKPYELRPGTIFFYGPETSHQIRTSPDHAMEKYFVAFDGGTEFLRECQILPGIVLQAMHPAQIHEIFDDLITPTGRGCVRSRCNISS